MDLYFIFLYLSKLIIFGSLLTTFEAAWALTKIGSSSQTKPPEPS